MGGVGRAVSRVFGGGGGGGGSSITYNVPQPAAPTPINYDAMYNAATRSAIATMREQEAQLQRLYPTMVGLQFGTVNELARGMDNQYLGTARNVISDELNASSRSSALEDAIQRRSANQFASGPTLADRQILGQSMMAMGQRADQVGGPRNIREIGAPSVSGVRADRVADVGSQDVAAGSLGGALMSQAMERAQSGGRLSAEASRDATQAARAGMAARGMATGSAGLAAEMLNRDRFARARRDEDNAFASGVQAQDLTRQFSNQESRMRAAMANQNVSAQQAMANQAAAMDAQRLNQAAGMQAQMSNQQRDQSLGDMLMRAQMANQAANQNQLAQNRNFMMAGRDAFNAAEDRRMNMALGANQLDLARRQRRLGLAGGFADLDPYARATGPAFQVGTANTGQGLQSIGQTFGNALTASGNVESFNRNMQAGMFNSWQNNNAAIQAANITGRASENAGMMSMFGGLAQGAGAYFSDERMKKDIKQTGKDGVLGLKTYEYRYKGEDKDAPKRTGFMAQDVAKVLPEAVEEVNYRGKKRLAIKPMVIGQTLAAALASQQDAMFADGYTVGKGFKG